MSGMQQQEVGRAEHISSHICLWGEGFYKDSIGLSIYRFHTHRFSELQVEMFRKAMASVLNMHRLLS
jgi:hypothetical protein